MTTKRWWWWKKGGQVAMQTKGLTARCLIRMPRNKEALTMRCPRVTCQTFLMICLATHYRNPLHPPKAFRRFDGSGPGSKSAQSRDLWIPVPSAQPTSVLWVILVRLTLSADQACPFPSPIDPLPGLFDPLPRLVEIHLGGKFLWTYPSSNRH